MEFFDKLFLWKNGSTNDKTPNGNELICLVHPNVKNDFLHVLFYPLDKKKRKEFEKDFDLKHNKGLESYIEFLSEHNGAVLYSGGIVFFGFTENQSINTFIEPPSLSRMNERDLVHRQYPEWLYIGNFMHREMDNVNMYINSKDGTILWVHKNQEMQKFKTLEQSLSHIYAVYNVCYKKDGENKNYNNRKMNVYENIQLY